MRAAAEGPATKPAPALRPDLSTTTPSTKGALYTSEGRSPSYEPVLSQRPVGPTYRNSHAASEMQAMLDDLA